MKIIYNLFLVFLLISFFISCKNDNNSDPIIDTDGDGVLDTKEIDDGTDPNDLCSFVLSSITETTSTDWNTADCDEDGVTNEQEIINGTNPLIAYPIAEFLPKLSELKLFQGNLANLEPTSVVDIYRLNTPLFTDYSHKKRFLSLPEGSSMTYDGDGFPIFPINTILTKTFYYNNDETNDDSTKNIIETRVLINTETDGWRLANYIWNSDQSDADLTVDEHNVSVDYINEMGISKHIDYVVPGMQDCVKCHKNSDTQTPIGPKVRNLNHTYNGENFIEQMITKGKLINAPAINEIAKLPKWDNTNNTLSERARAYLDVNCAHCHEPGGFYNISHGDNFDLRYETDFIRSNISIYKDQIVTRMHSDISQYGMPFIGTTIKHSEGIDLIEEYVNSL